jgi:CheY-like chemotaxis protein
MRMTGDEVLRKVVDFQAPLPESRVLVVDDEPVVLEVVAAVLEGRCSVLTAPDGNTGLETMLKERPAVVVTDKNLPDLSGLDLIRLGKKNTPDAEFLIITGYASLDTAIEAMDLGAFGYITKPFRDISDVRKRIDSALDKNRAVLQNRILVDRLKTAYEDLFKTKVEIEMLNDVAQERLRRHCKELKAFVDEVLVPFAGMKDDMTALVQFLQTASTGTCDAKMAVTEAGRAKMLGTLLETARRRVVELSSSLEQEAHDQKPMPKAPSEVA